MMSENFSRFSGLVWQDIITRTCTYYGTDIYIPPTEYGMCVCHNPTTQVQKNEFCFSVWECVQEGVEVEIFWSAEFSVYVRDSALMYVPLNDHIERMAA